MNTKPWTVAAALAALWAAPAAAAEGKIEIKLLVSGVLPDGAIDTVNSADPAVATALGASPGTRASDNAVPTLAAEYYLSPAVSVETICCFTQHHVTGTGSIAGADVADHLLILPATLTLKLHAKTGPIRPYIGAGPAVFLYFGEKPGAVPAALGATRLTMDTKLGVAVQGGFDIPVTASGLGLTLDAKRYAMKATTHFYAGSNEVLSTTHRLDPWVVSGGAYFRF